MGLATPLLNSFNGGELSPWLDARSDVNKYASGCRTLENFVPKVEGGVTRMPGTYFVNTVKHSDKITRLIGFHFSTVQAYIIEMGDKYLRFYKDKGLIVGSSTAWVTSHGYGLGDLVSSGGDYYRCIVAHTSGVFATDLGAGKWEPANNAADLAYEIPTTYLEAELFDVKFVQSADVLYLVHPSHKPASLTRTGHTAWVLADMTLTADPFSSGNYPAAIGFFEQRLLFGGSDANPQTIWASVSGDYDNFTVTADADDSSYEYTIASDRVDRIKWILGQDVLLFGTVGGIWKMSSSNGNDPITPTNVTCKKQGALGVNTIDPEPVADAVIWVSRAGTSVRQLVYDYSKDKWVAIDMTRVSKHITQGATEALTGIVDADFQAEPVPIYWAVIANGDLVGMTYENQEDVYAWFRVAHTGLFKSTAVISSEGAENELWVIVEREVGGVTKKFVEYFMPMNFYSQLKDAFFVESGLTFDGGAAVEVVGITQGNPAVVTVESWPVDGKEADLADGDEVRIKGVLGMTEVNQGRFKAYTVASANSGALTFELSGIDSAGWGEYISGGTVQKVTSTPSELDHLEGEEVDVVIDGASYPEKPTVASGSITLDYYGNKIHAGLYRSAILEPMKFHTGSPAGSSRGKMQKVTKLVVSFYETAGAMVGVDRDHLKPQPFGKGKSTELFTGDKVFEIDADWGPDSTISIVQDKPLPMTVLGIVPWVHIDEA